MEFEFDGHIRRVMERLLQEVEEIGRRQKAFEALAERILAEQAELRRRQEAQSQEWAELRRRQEAQSQEWAELRRRQEAQSQEWADFGGRWSAHFAVWERHLGGQIQQLEHFAQQLIALLPPEASEE